MFPCWRDREPERMKTKEWEDIFTNWDSRIQTQKSDRRSRERKSKMLNESLILPQHNTHKKIQSNSQWTSRANGNFSTRLQHYYLLLYLYALLCISSDWKCLVTYVRGRVCVFLYISKKLEGKNWKQKLSENIYSCVQTHARTHAHRYSSLQKVHTQVPWNFV